MSRRVLAGFISLNVLVSLTVAFLLITYDRAQRPDVEPLEGPTQIIVVSETPLPGSANIKPDQYAATISAQQLTIDALREVTPAPVSATEAMAVVEPGAPSTPLPLPTIDPALLPPIPTSGPAGEDAQAAALDAPADAETPVDDGCLRHTVAAGDVISAIAADYGVLPGLILTLNDMDENDFLQIGQVLIIPNTGCTLLYTPTPEPTATNTPFPLELRAATVTLPPTSATSDVEIVGVLNAGQVNGEAVELRNNSAPLNLEGWTLTGEDGTTYRFPEFRMQRGSRVRVFTREGTNTPAALYWGQDRAAWTRGETITLSDADGVAQATFVVGAE